MVSKSNTVDWGGLTVRVKDVYTGANKPGQAGTLLDIATAVSTAEVTVTGGASDVVIDGVTAAAGTGAGSAGASGGAVATHVLHVTVGGTDYYIPLCNTNA